MVGNEGHDNLFSGEIFTLCHEYGHWRKNEIINIGSSLQTHTGEHVT